MLIFAGTPAMMVSRKLVRSGARLLRPLILLAVVAVAIGLSVRAFWSADPADSEPLRTPLPILDHDWLQESQAESSMRMAADEEHIPLSLAPRIGEIVPRATRDVTPPAMTPGPPITGPLVRIPSPVPRKPRRKPPPRTERLHNPEITSAGSILTRAGPISIAGIDAPLVEESCGSGDQTWPCGVVSRAQLSRLIRGRAIECQIPPGASHLPDSTACSVAGLDLGEWLVRQGWAKSSGPRYRRQAEEAAAAKRGLWGSGRTSNSVCITNC